MMHIYSYFCVWYPIFPCYFQFISSLGGELKTSSHHTLPRTLFGSSRCRQLLAGCSLTPWNSFCSGRKHGAIKLKGSLKPRRSLGDSRASGKRRREPRLTCVPVACLSLPYSCTCCVFCSQRVAKGWVRDLRGVDWQKARASTRLACRPSQFPKRDASAEVIWCVCRFSLWED